MLADAAAAFDVGLLSPGTAGLDAPVGDAAIVEALVEVERALVRAYVRLGVVERKDAVLAQAAALTAPDARGIALAGVAGGNPVLPLVAALRREAGVDLRSWIHRGATSQDVLDTALALILRDAAAVVLDHLAATIASLEHLAEVDGEVLVPARTLTQQAVPTTIAAKARVWLHGLEHARGALTQAADALPVQLGGAGGTLAAIVDLLGADDARRLVATFADELGLRAPEVVWHTARWPIVALADALAGVVDATGKVAADVATASRSEIGELRESAPGASSAMPQKRNPVRSILIRSAALRAPGLLATIHLASALAVDERPDGAWHAEWPAVRELARLTLGAAALVDDLAAGLRVDRAAAAASMGVSHGLLVAERLAGVLGRERADRVVAAVADGRVLAEVVAEELAAVGSEQRAGDLLDPRGYLGLARPRPTPGGDA